MEAQASCPIVKKIVIDKSVYHVLGKASTETKAADFSHAEVQLRGTNSSDSRSYKIESALDNTSSRSPTAAAPSRGASHVVRLRMLRITAQI